MAVPRCNNRLIKHSLWYWFVFLLFAIGFVLALPSRTASSQSGVTRETEEAPVVVEVKKEWTFETLVPHLAEKYGQDEVLARKIISCESQNDPDAEGKNYSKETGEHWSSDHGYWQINDYWNEATANKHGYDIRNNWQDNLEWGFKMLKSQGTAPWKASKHCWNKQD